MSRIWRAENRRPFPGCKVLTPRKYYSHRDAAQQRTDTGDELESAGRSAPSGFRSGQDDGFCPAAPSNPPDAVCTRLSAYRAAPGRRRLHPAPVQGWRPRRRKEGIRLDDLTGSCCFVLHEEGDFGVCVVQWAIRMVKYSGVKDTCSSLVSNGIPSTPFSLQLPQKPLPFPKGFSHH